MNSNDSNINDLNKFIDDTRQGKFTEDAISVMEIEGVRYEYDVIEDINIVSGNVMLYGLSF